MFNRDLVLRINKFIATPDVPTEARKNDFLSLVAELNKLKEKANVGGSRNELIYFQYFYYRAKLIYASLETHIAEGETRSQLKSILLMGHYRHILFHLKDLRVTEVTRPMITQIVSDVLSIIERDFPPSKIEKFFTDPDGKEANYFRYVIQSGARSYLKNINPKSHCSLLKRTGIFSKKGLVFGTTIAVATTSFGVAAPVLALAAAGAWITGDKLAQSCIRPKLK